MTIVEHQPKQILAETKYLRLIQDGTWTYCQRPAPIGAIAIVAITDQKEIVLIDQYRIPTSGRVIELPAGLVGDIEGLENESLEQAARRELIEETGYDAKSIVPIINGASSAGLSDERIHLMMATDLALIGDGGGDELEDIIVHTIRFSDVHAWLEAQQASGKDVDFKVYAGLYFASRYLQTVVS